MLLPLDCLLIKELHRFRPSDFIVSKLIFSSSASFFFPVVTPSVLGSEVFASWSSDFKPTEFVFSASAEISRAHANNNNNTFFSSFFFYSILCFYCFINRGCGGKKCFILFIA